MSSIQQRIDDAFQVWGRAAPPMRADEGDAQYVRRIAQVARKKNYLSYDEPARRIEFNDIPDEYIGKFTSMLIDGIKRSVRRSDTVPYGTERAVFTRDENSGMAIRSFVRPDGESFVKDPEVGYRPCRRVTRISAPAGSTLWAAGNAATRRAASGSW
jgi:hypothetical protein